MPYKHSTDRKSLRFINNLIFRLFERFARRNYSVECTTKIEEIDRVFKNLIPKQTDHELIKIGGQGDGSYVIPNDLLGIRLVVSPGYGGIMNFEQELQERGIPSLILDKKVPEVKVKGIIFVPKFLSMCSDVEKQEISLSDVLSEFVEDSITESFLLQMDIENDEWLILNSVDKSTLKKFRIMVIEFHSLPLMRFPWMLERIISPVFDKILNEFTVVHLNQNTASGSWTVDGKTWYPDTIEVTFIRNDRVDKGAKK